MTTPPFFLEGQTQMRELRYKPVLNREEMCLVHELLHDELMRFSAEALEAKTRIDPTTISGRWEIEKLDARVEMIQKLKAKYGSVC